MTDLKPCPFCGGEATSTPAVLDNQALYAHCKDHTCPGWSVSRCPPALWNTRYKPKAHEAFIKQIADYVKGESHE